MGKTLSAEDVGILVKATDGCHKASKRFLVVEMETVRRTCGR